MTSRMPALVAALGLLIAGSPAAAEDLLPLGLSRLDPDKNPPRAAAVSLGKKLFFDKALSRDGTLSCATCHVPAEAFAQRGQAISKGIGGKVGRRNSPSLLNVAFAKHLFHDGRSNSLEDQAWQPILAADEMGNRSVEEVLGRLATAEEYPRLFEEAFGVSRPDKASVARALASFQRTLLSGNSPFDQWNWGGEDKAMSPLAVQGYELFAGQALCWQCHPIGGDHGIILTDQQFHNTGVAWRSAQQRKAQEEKQEEQPKEDLGRFEVTAKNSDRRQFKTPSLRNIALTAPYMHDGSFATLEEVVEFYNGGGGDGATQPLYLNKAELKAIVAFLNRLTGDQKFGEDPQK